MEVEVTNVQRELYFLIAKFLKSGPCQEAAKILHDELEKNHIVEKRLDWEGEEHDQSFNDMEKKYPHIGPRHLEEICCRLGPLLDKDIKPTVLGLKSLLGAGRQSLLRTKDSEKRFLSLVNFAARKNGISTYSPITIANHNVVQALIGQSISGPASRRHLVTPKMYSRVHLLNRTLGHLSAVYCLLFDRSGRYIITGADDLLVKVWSAVDGRLLHSFRGTSAEITDIDINRDNTLLAAGSLDKSIRVWCMQSGYPVATLSSHTGAITGVNFWPNSVDGCSFLVSTSSDGSIAFWSYSKNDDHCIFESKPLQYHEKLRPGQSQMLSARFSPGGMFLATGSADHHVRVYKMDREVPYRILEVEKHSDRVDSIQWANRGLKFVSGSKDGTAVLWHYQSQRWTIRHLLMSTTLNGTKGENEDNKIKLKVTMVCWNANDSYLITSVNDNTIKIWNPNNGKLLNVLKIHKDEVYVLENHPENPRVMLSAGHDGAVHLWDILTGEILSSYQNHIEGQGNGAVFDAKWSPDGTMIAATDAHGHILIFGIAPLSEKMQDVPKELFFHTDYRPIIRDAVTDQVIDEQTQVPPHLMPPPFLVDIEGTPYPPTFQRLVPGRENCTADQLIPNIVFTPGGQQEVVEGVVGEARSNIDQMIRALAMVGVPPAPRPIVSPRSRPRGGEEGVRQSSGNWHRDGLDWKDRVIISRLCSGAEELSRRQVESLGRLELEEYDRESRRPPETVPEVSTAPVSQKQHRRHAPAYRTRAVRDQQLREQVNEVPNEEPEYEQDSTSNHGDSSDVNSEDMSSESSTDSSSTEYSDWVADHGVNLEPPQRSRQRRAKKTPPPATSRPPAKKPAPVNINAPSCSSTPDQKKKRVVSRFPAGCDIILLKMILEHNPYDSSSVGSSWKALARIVSSACSQQFTTRAVKERSKYLLNEFTAHDTQDSIKTGTEEEISEREELLAEVVRLRDDCARKKEAEARRSIRLASARRMSIVDELAIPPVLPVEIPDSYKPSEWLSEVIPKKFPYYPQMGDEVMFFAQGYELYLKAVIMKRFYVLADTQYKPWGKLSLNEPEFVKIIGIKYELRPPRLCCLRLAIMKPNGKLTSDRFTIKYHDIPDVIDFFVLKQTYDIAMERQWKVGDRFRSMIDDGWWWGTIESRTKSNSKFLGYKIKWDNGESEAMSPWDMEPIDYSREPEVEGGSVPVLPEEISAILYHPRGDEWPGGDRETACRRILAGLEEIMGLAVAEPFNAPVDTNVYPTYSYIVEFPIDVSTIKARFENRFYRRVTAAQFDIRYLATNAEKFNEPHSSIVKQARIVTDLCLRICKDYNVVDVPLLYRQLLETYHSSASEPDEPKPSTSKELPRKERAAANRSLRAMNRAHQQQPDWRRDCLQLLDVLFNCRDSEPFREPVDRLEHPDYDKVIDTPMDLGTAREELIGGNYSNPLEFCKDMRMIFSNSRNYNTNKRSKIYVMTVRLSAMAEEHMKRIISNWKSSLRRQLRGDDGKRERGGRRKPVPKRRKKKKESDNDSTSPSEDGDSDYNTKKPARHAARKKKQTPETYDKSVHGESSGVRTNGLRSRTMPPAKRNAPSTSESNSNEESIALDIANGTSSSSFEEEEGPSSIAGCSQAQRRKMNGGKSAQQPDLRNLSPTAVGKRRVVASNNISYKESHDSSSCTSDDGPTKNWTMNGHIRVLRPVRRAALNTSVAEEKSSDSESESEEEVPIPRTVAKKPMRPVRQAVLNHSVKSDRSSDDVSSEEGVTGIGDAKKVLNVTRVDSLETVRGISQSYSISIKASSNDDTSDEEVSPDVTAVSVRNQRPVRQVANNVVFQRNGHASEVDSDDSDSESEGVQLSAANSNDEGSSEESNSEEEVEQKVIVLRNPCAPPVGRGMKRRRQSDSDYSMGSRDTGNRTLRTVKRMNYAPSNDSGNENSRPRRSQGNPLKYEDDSLGSNLSSVSNQPRNSVSGRPQRTLNKTYKEHSDDSLSEPGGNSSVVVRGKVNSRPVRALSVRQKYAQSSEGSESEEQLVSFRPKAATNKNKSGRPSRASKENQKYAEESDESMSDGTRSNRPNLSVSSRGRPRKSLKENHKFDDPSDNSENSDEEDSYQSQPKISISSRGRVRKITARARAFLRD